MRDEGSARGEPTGYKVRRAFARRQPRPSPRSIRGKRTTCRLPLTGSAPYKGPGNSAAHLTGRGGQRRAGCPSARTRSRVPKPERLLRPRHASRDGPPGGVAVGRGMVVPPPHQLPIGPARGRGRGLLSWPTGPRGRPRTNDFPTLIGRGGWRIDMRALLIGVSLLALAPPVARAQQADEPTAAAVSGQAEPGQVLVYFG